MATSEQIAAAAHTVKPTRGDGYVDRQAQHLLGGAYHPSPAEEHAAGLSAVRAALAHRRRDR